MARAIGNLTKRYFICKHCRVVFIEYVYVPYVSDINGNKALLENVIGDTTGLPEFSVFKTVHRRYGKRSVQSTLI